MFLFFFFLSPPFETFTFCRRLLRASGLSEEAVTAKLEPVKALSATSPSSGASGSTKRKRRSKSATPSKRRPVCRRSLILVVSLTSHLFLRARKHRFLPLLPQLTQPSFSMVLPAYHNHRCQRTRRRHLQALSKNSLESRVIAHWCQTCRAQHLRNSTRFSLLLHNFHCFPKTPCQKVEARRQRNTPDPCGVVAQDACFPCRQRRFRPRMVKKWTTT